MNCLAAQTSRVFQVVSINHCLDLQNYPLRCSPLTEYVLVARPLRTSYELA